MTRWKFEDSVRELPPDLKDLLRQTIVKDCDARLSFEALVNHPFLRKSES